MRILIVLALLVSSPASGDNEPVNGFVTHGSGELRGKVTDTSGKPVRGAKVHVVSKAGAEQIVTTDGDGGYRAPLAAGGHSVVFVHGNVRIGGYASVPSALDGAGEAIEIRETIPPAVMPKPLTNPLIIPEYSKTAIDRDAWGKAWLMLDIDEAGAVIRVKLLKSAGFDLDPIAVREGFKLRFEPARDRVNKPVRAMMIWAFEWPSYWWMLRHKHLRTRMPLTVQDVPCRGTATSAWYRDCSKPDMAKAVSQPWVDKP